MKNKLSFSKDGIKGFFFRHIEKMFFGLACGLILLFVWVGFKTPSFDDISPKQMLAKTDEAERYIQQEHWPKLQEHRIADTEAEKRIREAKAVDPSVFVFHHVFGTAVATLAPRRDPAMVPVKDFETKLVRALVAQAAKSENTGESRVGLAGSGINGLPDSDLTFPADQRNESFIYRTDKLTNNKLLTVNAVAGMALIDHRQQLTNYTENFQYQRGYDAARDVPEYSLIEVQRKTDDEDWISITAHIYTNSVELAASAKELGNDEYVLPNIALPIPPLLGIDYRQFSLIDGIPTKDVFDDGTETKKRQSRDDRSATDDSSRDGSPFGNSRNRSGSKDDKQDDLETKEEDVEESDDVIPVRLVRFYDLEPKEAGKTYYYRVRVWLKDPNNPDAVNSDIAADMKKSKDSRGSVGLGQGGGGSGLADGAGGSGGSGKDKLAKKKKPLSEFDLSGEVRDRIKSQTPDIPADIADAAAMDDEEKYAVEKGMNQIYAFSRPTEWVEAAQPVTITEGFETFVAGPVDAPTVVRIGKGVFSASEPAANIVVNSFQDDLEVFVPAKTRTLRGSLLNFEAVTNLLDPLTWNIKEVFASEDSRTGKKRGRRFKSDAVVLDIMGGERLGRGDDAFAAPGEVLIMDRNFKIHLHNDIQDTMGWRHANFVSNDNTAAMEAASKKKKKDRDDDDRGGSSD